MTVADLLAEIADLAIRADEAGHTVLSNMLMLIVRASHEAPATHKCLVNGAYSLMDAVESAHHTARR